MTIIEFYDKVALENIAGAMLCGADSIILVGDSRSKMEQSITVYDTILKNRGINTKLLYMTINRNNLQNIIDVLSEIVLSDESCVFDLTGGEDLYLVGVGAVMNKFAGRVQCHRFNFNNNTLYDCDADGNVCSTSPFIISAEENIAMYGGRIVKDETQPLHTFNWNIDEDLRDDIEIMWNLCKNDVGLWNLETALLGAMCDSIRILDGLVFKIDKDQLSSVVSKKHIEPNKYLIFLRRLDRLGLIESLEIEDNVSFTFKNRQIKRCLTLAGQILELIIANRMKSLKDSEGNPLYNEVIVGAVIDWDPAEEENQYRTINEIDILAMKGAIPIFISCKNGNFDENELYKLSTVADRFGSKYSRKILVATKLEKFGLKSDYLRARMKDMEIRCIDNITSMTDEQLDNSLRYLWIKSN